MHTKHIPIFLGLLALLSGAARPVSAQQPSPLFLGTKTPYRKPSREDTPAPPGFKPVFVNYVGRHGSRFMTKAGPDKEMLQRLETAAGKDALTEKGRGILEMTKRLVAVQTGKYEAITLLGKQEQEEIGKRISIHYREAFTGKGIEVVATWKARTQQSAEAFLLGFKDYPGKKNIRITPDSLDAPLRFYDLSPAYQSFKKDPRLIRKTDSLEQDPSTRKTAERVCRAVFKTAFAEELINEKPAPSGQDKPDKPGSGQPKPACISFAETLYDLYCAQFPVALEPVPSPGGRKEYIDFSAAFSREDLEWFSFINNAGDFLEKGPGTDTLGLQVKIAVPLLADFINSTETAIANPAHPDAILRFTHAEAISPFATLLGLPQASIPSAGIYNYAEHWQAASIIPMSANINWVVYSDGKEWLVKVLLNERETALPLATANFPYYKWQDVKEYYQAKMQSLKAPPGKDMLRWLREVN